MRHLLTNLPVELGAEARGWTALLAETFGGRPEDYRAVVLERKSLDARHKGNIRFLVALGFDTDREVARVMLPPGARLEPALPEVSCTMGAMP